MICTVCFKTKNDDKRLGGLVMLTIYNGQAMCYRCAAEAKASEMAVA